MRTVTRWICCFTGAAAIGICGGIAGMTQADAQDDPPLPPVEEEPAPPPEEPAPMPDDPPAPEEPAPMPDDPPAPQEPAPMPDDPPAPPEEPAPVPEQPIAPPEPPAALPEVDLPEPAAEVQRGDETAEVTGDTFDWVLDRVNELLQRQPQMEPPEHEEILDALVEQQVFVVDAKEEGVEVGPEEVEAEIDEIRATIPEGFDFEDALEQEGLTEDKFVSMMEDQLHAHAHIEQLAEQEEYQGLELTPQEEIGELLAVLMLELDANEYQIMAQRVDTVLDEVEVDIEADFDDVEAPEPEEPALPDLDEPLPEPPDEPAPMPEPDEPAPMPEPDEPAPMPDEEPAPMPEPPDEPAPQPDVPM